MNGSLWFVECDFVDIKRGVGRHTQATQVRVPGENAVTAFLFGGEAVLGIAGIDCELGSITQSGSENPIDWRLRRIRFFERRGVVLLGGRSSGTSCGRRGVEPVKANRPRSSRVDDHFMNFQIRSRGCNNQYSSQNTARGHSPITRSLSSPHTTAPLEAEAASIDCSSRSSITPPPYPGIAPVGNAGKSGPSCLL